jgi:hypothetical protein
MHNPFVLFSPKLLDALIKSGHGWFVRQTYRRGMGPFDSALKDAFLISHYPDQTKATVHFEALGGDPHRKIYAVADPIQSQQLYTAAGQPPGYKNYSPLLPKEWRPSYPMGQKIRRYLESQLHWKPGRTGQVQAKLFTQFGELFIILKYQLQETKVPLQDIEKI